MQKVSASAKVNLCLRVTGREGKMHLLDGIYAECALADEVCLSARQDNEVRVSYRNKKGLYDNDTAYDMARRLQEAYHTPGVDVVIDKKIPEGRGLGGSSADAAGVARAFSREFGLGEIDRSLLVRVGSDVPFQYRGGMARVGGRGEVIEPIEAPKLFLAILCPKKGVSTAECFALYDEVGGEDGDVAGLIEALKNKKEMRFFNALERAASLLAPEIGAGRKMLTDAGFSCGMTGSGSALFAAEYDEESFREKLKKIELVDGFVLLTTITKEIGL